MCNLIRVHSSLTVFENPLIKGDCQRIPLERFDIQLHSSECILNRNRLLDI